jgi:MFS family permease
MVRYLSEVNLMKIAFVLYFLVSLMMPLIHSLALYVLPVILFGVAQGMNIPSLQTLLVRLAPDAQRAIFMSMNGMVLRTGQTLGPLIIGLGFAFSGIEGAFYLAALLALLVLVLIFMMLQPLAKNPKRKGTTR